MSDTTRSQQPKLLDDIRHVLRLYQSPPLFHSYRTLLCDLNSTEEVGNERPLQYGGERIHTTLPSPVTQPFHLNRVRAKGVS
jgi:hypothetical protein